jgi:hypothetical protein
VLLAVAVVVLTAVGTLQTVNAIIGRPAQAIDTGLSILTSPSSAKALSTQIVTSLEKDAKDDTRLAFVEHRDAFIAAIGGVIQDQKVRELARADLLRAYDAINTGSKTTIDLKPLVTKFTTALHRVDARIPAVPKDFKNTTVTIDQKVEFLSIIDKLTLTVWIASIFGFGLAILVSRFLISNRTRRVIAIGLATALPTALLFSFAGLIGGIPKSFTIKDHEVEVLATALANHVGGVLLGTAFIFLGISVVTIAAFVVANRRYSARVTAAGSAGSDGPASSDDVPPPPPALVAEDGGEALAPSSPPTIN